MTVQNTEVDLQQKVIEAVCESVPPEPGFWRRVFKATWKGFWRDDVRDYAAALSYYALFSIIPLLLLTISILDYVIGVPDVEQAMTKRATEFLPGSGHFFREVADSVVKRRGPVLGISAVWLLLSSVAVFKALDRAINHVWGIDKNRNFWECNLLAVVMLLGAVLLLLCSLLLNPLFEFLQINLSGVFNGGVLGWAVDAGVSILATFLVMLVLFRYLPLTEVHLREVWLGALLTALLWQAAQEVFSFYVGYMPDFGEIYRSLSVGVAFMFWIFISSIIMLTGAEFTSHYARLRRCKIP